MKKITFAFALMILSCISFAGSRDPLKQPFDKYSIWNMPIGKGAVYVYANLNPIPRGEQWSARPQMDGDIIILHPEVAEVPIARNGTGWNNPDRCDPDGTKPALHFTSLPIPANFIVPNSSNNNGAAVMAKDRRFVYQLQPFTRCANGSTATALLDFSPVDIYGSGYSGAHGGSGLSSIGGTLRIGELRPSTGAPRHALKVNVDSASALSICPSKKDCYRWPAYGSDFYSTDPKTGYGTSSTTSVPSAMKMGALLAIPSSIDITRLGLQTKPGILLAWTLQNYGAYIVDSTGGAGFAIVGENGPDGDFRTQFKADWGLDFEGWVAAPTPWVVDIGVIMSSLSVVDNNGLNSIGGGGVTLQPLADDLIDHPQ